MKKLKYFCKYVVVLVLALLCLFSCSDNEDVIENDTEHTTPSETVTEADGNEFAKDNIGYYKEEWRN